MSKNEGEKILEEISEAIRMSWNEKVKVLQEEKNKEKKRREMGRGTREGNKCSERGR